MLLESLFVLSHILYYVKLLLLASVKAISLCLSFFVWENKSEEVEASQDMRVFDWNFYHSPLIIVTVLAGEWAHV